MTTKVTSIRWFPQMQQDNAESRVKILKALADAGWSPTRMSKALDGALTPQAIGRYLAGDRLPVRRVWGHIDRLARHLGHPAAVPTAVGAGSVAQGALPPDAPMATVPNTKELRAALLDAMERRDWSWGQLARACGYDSANTIRRLLTTDSLAFFPAMLAAVARALDLPIDELPISLENKQVLHSLAPVIGHAQQVRDIPVIASAHAAELTVNDGVLAFPNWQDAPKVPAPTDGRRYLAFRVDGNSMTPQLADGDVVLVDAKSEPQPGKIAVVFTTDDEILVKVWRPLPNGQVLLDSLNPDNGADRVLDPTAIRWARRAVKRTGDL